jgi:excisionase family DNA binding protein
MLQTHVSPIPSSLPSVREYFVDADEAARFLKIDRRTVLEWARLGRVPAHPLDPSSQRKDWRFLLSELDAWLRSQVTRLAVRVLLQGEFNEANTRKTSEGLIEEAEAFKWP